MAGYADARRSALMAAAQTGDRVGTDDMVQHRWVGTPSGRRGNVAAAMQRLGRYWGKSRHHANTVNMPLLTHDVTSPLSVAALPKRRGSHSSVPSSRAART